MQGREDEARRTWAAAIERTRISSNAIPSDIVRFNLGIAHLRLGNLEASVKVEPGIPGAAYVYDVTTGEPLFKLMPSDPTDNDHFGDASPSVATLPLSEPLGTAP